MINQLNDDQIRNSELDEIRNSGLKENNALRVHTYLRANERARSRRLPRWIWELLQNALDASTVHNDPLTVKIEYNPEELVFLHNGSSFKGKQIFNLIYHGSTKADEEETIGEYGSGFLTTHLLSPEIKVSGQLDNKQWFDFHLTRRSDSPDALLDLMDEAWENFKESLSTTEQSIPNSFTTRFIYPIIGEDAQEAVERGIETLKQCTPFVVVFNSKLSRIDIDDHHETLRFEVIERRSIDASEIQYITVAAHENGNLVENKDILISGEKKTSVAVPLKSKNDGSVCQSVEKIPRLFKALPLVGTESFGFPAVINSLDFKPSEDRDDVYIGLGNDEANTENQTVIEKSCELLVHLLQYAASEGWHHVHQWAEVPTIQHPTEETRRWLGTCIREKFIGEIRKAPIVLNEVGNAIVPKMASLPLVKRNTGVEIAESDTGVETLWELMNDWQEYRETLPRRSEAIGWCQTIRSWAEIYENKPVTSFSEVMDGEKLAAHIEEKTRKDGAAYGSLADLQNLLQEDVSAIEWLNRLHHFFYERGLREAVRESHIVADQAGSLDKLSALYRDQDIDEELKEIAELLDWQDSQNNWKLNQLLRDKRLTSLAEERGAGNKDNEEVLGELIEELQEHAKKDPDNNFKQASARLFAWIVGKKNYPRLGGFPAFAADSKSVLILPNPGQDSNPPLAPVPAWSEGLGEFENLFPEDRILANDFFKEEYLPEVWQKLDEQGFIRWNMMIQNYETNLKVLSPEVYGDNKDHESVEPVHITDFIERGAIMNRVRDYQNLGRLFWQFLTEWLVKADSQGLETKLAKCESCGNDHRYYPASWMIPVLNNQWIRQKGNLRVSANAKSLASLLRNSEWDPSSLNENPAALKLLEEMDVSLSDLKLGLIAESEEKRNEVINLATTLYDVNPNDLSQVNELVQHASEGNLSQINMVAQDLKKDKDLFEELEKRRRRREIVHKNQELGKQVENLVKENLKEKNFDGKGFTVERTGKGSDFEMEDTEGITTLNVAQENRKWLIEVKATRTEGDHQSVRMTSTQAQTAVDEREKFLLCVVPLGQEDVTRETIKENMYFIQNIGDSIDPLWKGLKSLKKKSANIDIILDVEEGKAGIRVQKSVWENEGFPLKKLAEHLK